MLLTGIISSTYANIYSIVIGKWYDGAVLGIFNRGQKLARLFPEITESVLGKNSLPILSQLQDDRDRLIHVYREFVKLACFITFPAVCMMSLLAEPFIRLVLTEKWMDSVIYVQIFAVTALLYPVNSVNLNLLQTFGRSDYTLRAEVIKKTVGVITVFLLLPLGPLWLAVGSCCMDVMALVVNAFYAKKLSGLAYRLQLLDIVPAVVCTLGMSVAVFLVCRFFSPDWMKLILGGLTGVAVYYVLTRFVFRMDIYSKALSMIRR
jgi:O-antigen/teichoic acid export membrane protein